MNKHRQGFAVPAQRPAGSEPAAPAEAFSEQVVSEVEPALPGTARLSGGLRRFHVSLIGGFAFDCEAESEDAAVEMFKAAVGLGPSIHEIEVREVS